MYFEKWMKSLFGNVRTGAKKGGIVYAINEQEFQRKWCSTSHVWYTNISKEEYNENK